MITYLAHVIFLISLMPAGSISTSIPPNSNIISMFSNASSHDPFFPLNFPPLSQCTNRDNWSKPRFSQSDCIGALDYLYYEEMTAGGLEKLEFLTAYHKPTTFFRPEPTPRKYTFGTCTITIVMVDYFTPGILPGTSDPGASTPTDVATWEKVLKVAESVYELCVGDKKMAGWDTAGIHQSIAVAIWSTGSSMDMITGDFTRFIVRKPVNASTVKA